MSFTYTTDPPGNASAAVFNPSAAAPEQIAAPEPTDTPAQTGGTPFTPAEQGLPAMPASFSPAFIELTGAGPSLATLNASAVDVVANRILQGTVNGELKSYQVRAGTDAQALPGIVRPANFDAVNNPVVFVEL